MAIGTITHTDADGVFQWQIEGFASLEVGTLYWSPNFSFARREWSLWIRRVCPERGRRVQRIDLCLRRCGGVNCTLDVEYTFSVRDRDGDRHGQQRNRMEFRRVDMSPWIPFDLEEERMSDLVPDNILTVLCHIERIDPTREAEAAQLREELQQKTVELAENQSELVRLRRLNEELNLKVTDLEAYRDNAQKLLQTKSEDCCSGSSSLLQKNQVLRDYKDLFHKKEECDVVLKVQGQEFPAHKAILTARSPVLATALRTDMKERATGVVEIEDCDPSSFSDFLCYLYCGAVENLSSENVFYLFTSADKYDIRDLRSECLEFVKENLSVDTFCDTITLALRHSETELIDLATDFFTQNAPQIIVTVKWQQFSIDYPTHSNELFIKFATSSGRSNK